LWEETTVEDVADREPATEPATASVIRQ
jgi:hypothetical protein